MLTTRREFLQTSAIIAGSLLLPRSLFAKEPDRFFFLHAETGTSWPVPNPVQWSLDHVHEPILERASEGLLQLTPNDGDRIIRLVVRRCGLNLIELQPRQVVVHHWGQQGATGSKVRLPPAERQVVVHHWGQQGLADLRAFFKSHGLARRDVQVIVRDRKKEESVTPRGDCFLFGNCIAFNWLPDLYLSKWQSRFEQQPDDWIATPWTWSGYAWEGVEDNRIPWAALKSAWRRSSPMICLNCDQPTVLVKFGHFWVSMFNRLPRFIHACGACQMAFQDESIKDVDGWIMANLDAEVRPDFR